MPLVPNQPPADDNPHVSREIAVLEPETCDDGKSPWKSKTLWAALITAVVPVLFPPAAAVIAANPALVTALVGAGFAALRCRTDTPVDVKKALPPKAPKAPKP